MTTTANWIQWEKQVVNGIFPLYRALSHSDHSAVFLTEHRALDLPDAILKLVPAIPTFKDTQLAYWDTAATLTHPRLVRVLETGQCQLGGLQFLFVVMEYAGQTLEEFLSRRALAPGALEPALRSIISALAFLHRNQLVHGGLKPSNVLRVNREVKLSSDTVRPVGEPAASIAGASAYDPPEARDGSFGAPGDIWSLGMLIVEALTRRLPQWQDKDADRPELPTTLPEKYATLAAQCLNRDPARRPTVDELEKQFNMVRPTRVPPTLMAASPALQLTPEQRLALTSQETEETQAEAPKIGAQLLALLARESVHYPVLMPAAPARAEIVTPSFVRPRRASVGALTAFGFIAGLIGVGAFLHLPVSQAKLADSNTVIESAAALPTMQAPATTAIAPTAAQANLPDTAPTRVAAALTVLREATPDVPEGALKTIHGHIKFAVRLEIDGSGEVVRTSLASRSPSKYFTRLAMQTAREWQFIADEALTPRHCLVWFDFTRRGAIAYSDLTKMRYAQRD